MLKAVLVAMADEVPFSSIKEEIYPRLTEHYSEKGYETFFVYGRKQGKSASEFRKKVEQLRWNKYHKVLRFYDVFALALYKWKTPKCSLSGQNIIVNVPEDLRHLSTKILTALDVLDGMGYEIVVRTTVSSILNLEMIEDRLKNVPLDREIYGGRINHQNDGFIYVSGSLTIFNGKCIKLLKKNMRKLDFSLIDDVSIGKLMNKLRVMPSIRLETLDIASTEDLTHLSDKGHFAQIRCKSGVRAKDRIDSLLMRQVIEMLKL